jgi:formyltetrahydrofolate deformylase
VENQKAILLLSCPDTLGIVSRISHFIFERRGNILSLDQHVDVEKQRFFMRVEWSLANFTIPAGDLHEAFAPLAKEFKADWHLELISNQRKPNLAIFVSHYDHCLQDLLWRTEAGELNCQVPLIISNHQTCAPIAERHGIKFVHLPINKENKEAQENTQKALIKEYQIDLIVLARYMQILTPAFTEQFPAKIINIHHSFLPAFTGGKPYQQAQERGVKIIGATSHYATAELDEGPIIQQDITHITHKDALEDLVYKGRDLERIVLARAVKLHLEHRILVHGLKTIVFES